MKKLITKTIVAALMTGFFIFNAQSTKACVDPDTTVVIIRVDYDTVNAPLITKVIVTLTNLRLMNEAPNKVCACAFTKISAMFTNLDYIAFVYAGTTNPYKGFASFDANSSSSAEWNSSTTKSWSGFVATVVNAGLKATEPVDLIIRASTPSGVAYTLQGDSSLKQKSLVEAVNAESLGTDEWNKTTNKLVNAHRGIQNLSGKTINYSAKPSTYFTNVDTSILNNLSSSVKTFFNTTGSVNIHPNPSSKELFVTVNIKQSMKGIIEIIDIKGQVIITFDEQDLVAGNNKINLSAETESLPSGSYLLKVATPSGSITQQFVKN